MSINRYWYSREQDRYMSMRGNANVMEVLVNGEWHKYTQRSSNPGIKCNWKDAVLVAESEIKLPVMIDGILQGSL